MVNHPNRGRKTAQLAEVAPTHDHDADYAAFRAAVQTSFDAAVATGSRLFCTTAESLNETYLTALPSDRQTHSCSACRRFIEAYGALVTIADDGTTSPVMWSASVPDFYWPALIGMGTLAQRARVTGPFLSSDTTWGMPQTRNRAKGVVWHHLSVQVPASLRYRERGATPGQAMAAKREDFGTVARALAEFTPHMLDEALRLLETESLYRSERFVAPVKWLRTLHDRPKGRAGENVLWRAIAAAPDGFCHPRASMIGSLLEDIADGLPFDDIKMRFDAKMHPLRFQRPQVAPSAGNIAAAEALVEKLGIRRSLERRFARLDEIETIWRPKDAPLPPSDVGVFGHLRPKGHTPPPAVDIPTITMTWDKFCRTVLASAEELELVPPLHGNYSAMLTAEHADAPPIIKWDRDDARNPVTSYVYANGSPASQWKLFSKWTRVLALAGRPNMWGSKPLPELGEGITAILPGAVDTREDSGNAIFPEMLRADLHGVRSTIESFSRRANIGGRHGTLACGLAFGKGAIGIILRVLAAGRWTVYKIDRWD